MCSKSKENLIYNLYADRKTGGGALYRKMIKLKDGRVFIIRRGDAVADIREQVMQEYFQPTIRSEFIFCGNYIVSLHPKLGINVHQIYED